LEVQEISL